MSCAPGCKAALKRPKLKAEISRISGAPLPPGGVAGRSGTPPSDIAQGNSENEVAQIEWTPLSRAKVVRGKGVHMETARKRLPLEPRSNAAHRVIDSDRNVMEVAKDLSPAETTLAEWVRRGEAPAGSCRQHQRGAARRSGAAAQRRRWAGKAILAGFGRTYRGCTASTPPKTQPDAISPESRSSAICGFCPSGSPIPRLKRHLRHRSLRIDTRLIY